jgi:hypothetical protein
MENSSVPKIIAIQAARDQVKIIQTIDKIISVRIKNLSFFSLALTNSAKRNGNIITKNTESIFGFSKSETTRVFMIP